MNAALLRHAISTIWCNPAQDRQFTYELRRLTPVGGLRDFFTMFYETVNLPTESEAYHVYQIGQVFPNGVGLPNITRQWMSLSDLAEQFRVMIELYIPSGIQFPRFNSYLWITPNRNVVIAVKVNRRIANLDDLPLYLRFYSNAYWNSDRSEGQRHLYSRGLKVNTQNQLLLFQRDILKLVNDLGGYPYYFVNGRFVHNISLVSAMEGDVVDFVLDGSIKKMVEFTIADQPTFLSELDDELKYILHYDDPSVTTIEYIDDADIFLYQSGINNRFMGTAFHRNQASWLRMLTHKDYSISVSRLMQFVQQYPGDERVALEPTRFPRNQWETLEGKTLRVYLRHAGFDRPLEPEANRIKQLYRLPSDRIVRAMTGDDATVDVWRASALEQSAYTQFMSLPPEDVYAKTFNRVFVTSEEKQELQELVGEVYGYHAAATLLAGTPSTVYSRSGLRYADLAHEHQVNATVFEYDAQGLLLGWYTHLAGAYYLPRHLETVRVECLGGRGSYRPRTVHGNDPVPIAAGHNYRLYVRERWNNAPRGEWLDITDADNRSTFGYFDDVSVPNRWVWTIPASAYYTVVRVDDSFLCYDLTLTRSSGQLQFHINLEEYINGVWEENHCELPFGQIDLFLNGKALAEGIDYHIEWPRVVIFNLEYLREPSTQYLTVRGYGFANADLSRLPKTEVGFVEYGVLSNNHHFDIHTNKVLRVVIDGRYYDPADVVFDEQLGEFTMDGVRNGAPYFIQTPPVFFRDVYENDLAARVKDDAINDQVSNYLTEYYPTPVREHLDLIERPYRIFSPFAQKILHDLIQGWFYPDGIEGDYGAQEVRQWCKDYEWLLPFDPCNTDYDDIHVEIYPCWYDEPVSIDLYKYRFFHRVLTAYLRHPPDTAQFIKIS